MPSFFDHWQAENKATSLEAEGAPWLLKQKLVPEAGHQGRLRIRFNLAAETLSTLEEYLACFAKNDASVMFTLPMLPAQQALTWLQAEPLQHCDHYYRGTLIFLAVGVLTWAENFQTS